MVLLIAAIGLKKQGGTTVKNSKFAGARLRFFKKNKNEGGTSPVPMVLRHLRALLSQFVLYYITPMILVYKK